MTGHIAHFEYFKYWLSVRHLILKKHMTFEEILNTNLNLNEVLDEAKRNGEGDLSAIKSMEQGNS